MHWCTGAPKITCTLVSAFWNVSISIGTLIFDRFQNCKNPPKEYPFLWMIQYLIWEKNLSKNVKKEVSTNELNDTVTRSNFLMLIRCCCEWVSVPNFFTCVFRRRFYFHSLLFCWLILYLQCLHKKLSSSKCLMSVEMFRQKYKPMSLSRKITELFFLTYNKKFMSFSWI